MALLTSACVGNAARVISGPCTGAVGLVTGKHGGVNHVLIDFDTPTLLRLNIRDHIQIYALGLGLRLLDHPAITVSNAAPGLLRRLALRRRGQGLEVPVTHILPASLIGSGLGKNTAWRGDFDIQLADGPARARFRLNTLRFGDIVAVTNEDARFGPSYRRGRTTIGVIVHGDSTVSGHGPGVTALLTGPNDLLHPSLVQSANLAILYGRRVLPAVRGYRPLIEQKSRLHEAVSGS
jgi:hypothetical protein